VRATISTWPSYQHVPNGNFVFFLKLKVRVILSLISAVLTLSSNDKRRLKLSSEFRLENGTEILVLANGATLLEIDNTQLLHFIDSGGAIFSMNGYALSEFAASFPPTIFFVTDPNLWEESSDGIIAFRSRLEDLLRGPWKKTIVAQPVHQPQISQTHKRYLYLTNISSASILRKANPFGFWGLVPSTALVALGVAKRMQLGKVYFGGLDGDSYRYFYTDELNNLLWENNLHHFYVQAQPESTWEEKTQFTGISTEKSLLPSLADALYAESILRRDFNWLSKGEFINVTSSPHHDMSPRACLIRVDCGD